MSWILHGVLDLEWRMLLSLDVGVLRGSKLLDGKVARKSRQIPSSPSSTSLSRAQIDLYLFRNLLELIEMPRKKSSCLKRILGV